MLKFGVGLLGRPELLAAALASCGLGPSLQFLIRQYAGIVGERSASLGL